MSEAKNCRLAAIQMISGPDVADNLRTAAHWIAEAAAQGAQLVVLPEYFPIIGATDAVRLAAREAFGQGPIQDWLAATAQRHGIWLVAGSLPLSADAADKMRNSCLLFDPAGACVARYDKIHLFGFRQGNEAYDAAAVIEVEDDGPGIPPEHLEDVFKRFYTSRPDEHFGRNSGLGLSISKQIVDVHDGTIRAANRPGPTPGSRAGAVFTIRLKLP